MKALHYVSKRTSQKHTSKHLTTTSYNICIDSTRRFVLFSGNFLFNSIMDSWWRLRTTSRPRVSGDFWVHMTSRWHSMESWHWLCHCAPWEIVYVWPLIFVIKLFFDVCFRQKALLAYQAERQNTRDKEDYVREKYRDNIRQKYGIERKLHEDAIEPDEKTIQVLMTHIT